LDGLGAMELEMMKEWEAKVIWRYPRVGRLIQDA
jgi:hypothetical protein